MGTRNAVTRTIFGENALSLHFLGLASSGCFDYVVAFAPTALNMTEGEGLENRHGSLGSEKLSSL
jgi:hypothetical protein